MIASKCSKATSLIHVKPNKVKSSKIKYTITNQLQISKQYSRIISHLVRRDRLKRWCMGIRLCVIGKLLEKSLGDEYTWITGFLLSTKKTWISRQCGICTSPRTHGSDPTFMRAEKLLHWIDLKFQWICTDVFLSSHNEFAFKYNDTLCRYW